MDPLGADSLAEVARYVDYLRWKEGSAAEPSAGKPRSYDFVEHFRKATVTVDHDPAGLDVQVGEAACDGDWRMALWQHPPLHGSVMVEYQVPVPTSVRRLGIRFATGIRDGSDLAPGNVVTFRIFVNDWKVWSDTQTAKLWIEREVAMPSLPGDVARIQFATDGLGNHQWAWAAWRSPRLVGETEG
ncbi:hypothetical protein ACFLWA_02225 [Chloroflexota bacterium]